MLILAAVGLAGDWSLTTFALPADHSYRLYSPSQLGLNLILTLAVAGVIFLIWEPGKLRRRSFALVAVAMSLGVTLFLLELPTVLFGFDWGTVVQASGENAWPEMSRDDPDMGWRNRPGAEYRGEVLPAMAFMGTPPSSYAVDLKYDLEGFRNRVFPTRADAVAIGDSFVEGVHVPADETVPAVLGSRLGQTVANLGQSGYGPQQELIVLRRFGLPLSPEVVLWFFFAGNDFRNARSFEDRSHAAVAVREPKVVPLLRRSLVWNALALMGRALTPEDALRLPSSRARSRSGLFTRKDGRKERVYFLQPTPAPSDRGWEIAETSLRTAAELARDRDARFLLVYVPRKFEVYRDAIEISSADRISKWIPLDIAPRMRELAREIHCEFVDTTPTLRERAHRGEHTYLLDDPHWNPAGHRAAADAILEHLRR